MTNSRAFRGRREPARLFRFERDRGREFRQHLSRRFAGHEDRDARGGAFQQGPRDPRAQRAIEPGYFAAVSFPATKTEGAYQTHGVVLDVGPEAFAARVEGLRP